jgi:hypothetical protein
MHNADLAEVRRLLSYLREQAVDSQNIPVTSEELPPLANCLISRLVVQNPLLNEVIQEELDNLRYKLFSNESCGAKGFPRRIKRYTPSTANEV